MKIPPHPPAWPVLAVLLFLGGLIAASRYHTRHEPVERDLAVYAVLAHEMLQGRALYSDLWDHKPPAIYCAYALAEKITGYGSAEIYVLGVGAAFLTLLGAYAAGTAGGMGKPGGFWAACFWALTCSDMLLQANQPNVEVFLNAALLGAFALLVSGRDRRKTQWGAGLLLALGAAFKPQVSVLAPLFSLAHFLSAPRRDGRGALVLGWRLLLPTAVLWAGQVFYFTATGRWRVFYEAMVVYNAYYAGSAGSNLLEGLKWRNLCPGEAFFLLPLLLAALAGIWKNRGENPRLWRLWAAYGAGLYLSVAVSGKFFPHYYQLWLPWLSVGAAWAVTALSRELRPILPRICLFPGLFILVFLVCYEAPTFLLSAQQWSLQKYGRGPSDARDLGLRLGSLLKPDEDFYSFGNESGLYFYSRKSPPSGIFFISPVLEGPLQETLSARLFRDLGFRKPDLLVVDNFDLPGYSRHFLNKYFLWKYYPGNGHFSLLMKRKGS